MEFIYDATGKVMVQYERCRSFLRRNEGVSALEYAILVGVVAVGIGAALVTFQAEITAALGRGEAKIKALVK